MSIFWVHTLHCMMNKSHIQNTILKAINIYIHILIYMYSDKNVELQLYAKIVFLKYVSSICLNYR